MKKKFDPDAEAEHLRRIMTSRDVAIRDAWSVLKAGFDAGREPMHDYECKRCGNYFTAPEGLNYPEEECPHCNPSIREIFG